MNTNKVENINDLPNELLLSIFKHLKIKDFSQCRLVCKRFWMICDEVIITELVISNTIENVKEFWIPTNEQYNHKDAIDVATFIACRSRFRFDKFLKRLHFKGSYEDYQALNLNGLSHIEQLTIDVDFVARALEPVIDIDLPNLKILQERCGYFCVVRLNTPKLEMLKCDDFHLVPIHLNHPDTINYLELYYYYASAATFKNVKYLKVGRGFENIRSAHPNLEQLVCNYRFADEEEDDEERNIVSVNAIRQLFKQRGRQTKIYFQSVKLENVGQIEEYDPDNHVAFQIRNYGSLGDNVFCDSIQYNELMETVDGNLPLDFYKKYFNTGSIHVTGNVIDVDHLMGFLKRFEYLDCLWLDSSSFDQSFYDFLPRLDQLSYLDLNKISTPITSYNFLFKLPILKQFTTDRDSSDFFDLTVALFQQLKYFETICYCYEQYLISIYKDPRTKSYNFCQELEDAENGTKELIFEKLDIDDLNLFFKWALNNTLQKTTFEYQH